MKNYIKNQINRVTFVTGEKITDKSLRTKFKNHTKTVLQHKLIVFKYCNKVGLYKQGLVHDLSKFNPKEFIPSVLFFQDGKRSPNNAEREKLGMTKAWLHHKGRNRHHFEYWIDYDISKKTGLKGMNIPNNYIIEMFIDRIAACKVYQGNKYTKKSAWEYYERSYAKSFLDEKTRNILEHLLKMLYLYDEEITFKYIKECIKNNYCWNFEEVNKQWERK